MERDKSQKSIQPMASSSNIGPIKPKADVFEPTQMIEMISKQLMKIEN
jgi:hypothetical protein